MANRSGIDIIFLPRDENYFEDLVENRWKSERYPGLMEGGGGDTAPYTMNDFAGRPFLGIHGSHAGDYPARLIACPGDAHKNIFEHDCDENGKLSLVGTEIGRVDSPLVIPNDTVNFMLSYRAILKRLLDEAAAGIEERMGKIEQEEEEKRRREDPGTEAPVAVSGAAPQAETPPAQPENTEPDKHNDHDETEGRP